ncbi:restriction endonuclease subunit S [Micromonospora tulbaghiae]
MTSAEFQQLFATPLRNGVSYPSATRGSGVPMVNMGEAFRYDVIADQECERVPLSASERQRYLLEEGDLLFVRQSLKFEGAGRCVYVAAGSEPRTWESHLMRVRLDSTRANPRYYYYYFRSALGRESIEPIIHQVAAAGIRGSDLSRLQVPIPPLQDQNLIVSVLSALDDKIAVNDRIAETTLQLAEALYLRESTKHDWSSIDLGSAATWRSGGTPKTSEPRFWGGEIPWVSASSLKSCWVETSERRLTELGVASGTRLIPAGAVIFVVRGSSLKEEFRIGLTQREVAFGQDCKALVARPGLDPHILFHGIRSARAQVLDLVDETSIGAGRLSTDLITKLEIRVPSKAANEVVEEIRSLDHLSAVRTRESRGLSALRDALLPELMSGRLRVKDAEKVVEKAV